MKRSAWAAAFWNIVLAFVLAGCGNSSTGDKPDPPADLTSVDVVVSDFEGNPLAGFEVFTTPATRSATTDSTGKATLENLVEGGYLLTVRKEGYTSFSRVYPLGAAFPLTITIKYIPHISITVRDQKGRPVAGASLTTDPQLPEKVLDQNGRTEYVNLPEARYSFIVKRDKFPDASFHELPLRPEMDLVLETSPPQVGIISPLQNAKIATTRNIRLSGKGSDLDDGELPDSSLVWSSNQSGELGRGRELVVDVLDPGDHIITLSGTDSDGKQSATSIEIMIYDYFLETSFPMPEGETWDYRVLAPEFYVTEDGGLVEYWSIKELSVNINAGMVREITMRYVVARGKDVFHCDYILTDHLQVEGESLYITSTEENYLESVSGSPALEMNISTQYMPRYQLFKNFMDLSMEKNWSAKSDINVRWSYTYYGTSYGPYSEWQPISATFSLGEEQSVQTDQGAFPAVELTIQTNNGATRKWMLAKGLGIIRIEDGTYNPTMTAQLHNTSLFALSMKAFGSGIAPPPSTAPPPRYDLRINRRDARDVRKLCKLLSTMCIR